MLVLSFLDGEDNFVRKKSRKWKPEEASDVQYRNRKFALRDMQRFLFLGTSIHILPEQDLETCRQQKNDK